MVQEGLRSGKLQPAGRFSTRLRQYRIRAGVVGSVLGYPVECAPGQRERGAVKRSSAITVAKAIYSDPLEARTAPFACAVRF